MLATKGLAKSSLALFLAMATLGHETEQALCANLSTLHHLLPMASHKKILQLGGAHFQGPNKINP
jgi:hypothetical protein